MQCISARTRDNSGLVTFPRRRTSLVALRDFLRWWCPPARGGDRAAAGAGVSFGATTKRTPPILVASTAVVLPAEDNAQIAETT
eukprot:8315662-Pyramimonas_sp.AAC.1